MATHVRKSKDGWYASTDCPVPDNVNLILKVSTAKHQNGGLITEARVHHVDPNTGARSYDIFSDFYCQLARSFPTAVTELAVRNQHLVAMGMLKPVMADVKARYGSGVPA